MCAVERNSIVKSGTREVAEGECCSLLSETPETPGLYSNTTLYPSAPSALSRSKLTPVLPVSWLPPTPLTELTTDKPPGQSWDWVRTWETQGGGRNGCWLSLGRTPQLKSKGIDAAFPDPLPTQSFQIEWTARLYSKELSLEG